MLLLCWVFGRLDDDPHFVRSFPTGARVTLVGAGTNGDRKDDGSENDDNIRRDGVQDGGGDGDDF